MNTQNMDGFTKGNYKVLFEKMDFQGNDKFPNFYKWEYNFLDNLTRATSSKQINNTKKIHIFGDS